MLEERAQHMPCSFFGYTWTMEHLPVSSEVSYSENTLQHQYFGPLSPLNLKTILGLRHIVVFIHIAGALCRRSCVRSQLPVVW